MGTLQKNIKWEKIAEVRLCARRFIETQKFWTVSPSCNRIGHTALAVLKTNSWCLKSKDAKTIFHQGKEIEQEVYTCPPKEANTNNVWKLQTSVYGLADASRYWYLQVKETTKLGVNGISTDPRICNWKEKYNHSQNIWD